MKIRWEVNDGYAGGSRPQTFSFHEGDWDDCETEGEALEEVCNALDEELTALGYSFDEDEVRRAFQEWKEGEAQ